jgi:WASH complex subunit strumpellin
MMEAQLEEDTLRLQQFEQRKYEQILFNMAYLGDQDYQDSCDEKIQGSIDLIEIDEQFKDSYLDIIERFYSLFESIYQYYAEINEFVSRVRENYYIDFAMENVLQEKEGRRLLIEVYYNYGTMLLLLDRLIPAIARERMVVCYVRYRSAFGTENTAQVAKMCKSTHARYTADKAGTISLPAKYPMDYFGRFNLDRILIETLINALKDDDIYNQLAAYPNPAHRSIALANQAQMIFVLLGFTPRLLEHEQAKMREISDKHFPDNFVIQIYQGYLVDVTQYWEPFPAARKAIENNIYLGSVKTLAEKNAFMVKNCFERLTSYVVDGQLLEEYVLDNVKALLDCLRDSNVTVRWLMLHNNCKNKEFRETVQKSYDKATLVNFLLQLAKFENQFETMIRKLVQSQVPIWDEDRRACHDYIHEVSEYFAGNRNWGTGHTDEQYASWFASVAE